MIVPGERGAQIPVGDAPTASPALADLHVADALGLGRVKVVCAWDAGLDGGGDERLRQWISVAQVGDLEGPLRAPLEVGNDVVPGPAGITAGGPAVVVGAVAAYGDLCVDRR